MYLHKDSLVIRYCKNKSPELREKILLSYKPLVEYIAKKLGISTDELQMYFDQENKTYRDYKNQLSIFNAGAKILKMFGMERSIKRW